MGIKICTTADIHIGVTTYGTIDPKTGLNTRILNCLNSIDNMIDYCIKNKINYMIIAGDAYKNNLPSPTIQNQFDARIKRASDNGIKIYIMDGNHDVSTIETARSAMDTFKTLKVDNVFQSRFKKVYYIENKLKIITLPTYCSQEEIEQILEEDNQQIPTIVVGHLTLKGAKLNDWLIEQNENAIDVNIFKKPNIAAVVLGHLHKYQILNNDPLIYYTGSLQRIDFTEEHQEKGFVILDIDTDNFKTKYEFIEIPSQKFFTLDINLEDSTDEMSDILKEIEDNKLQMKDCITRLRMKLNKNNNVDDRIIIKELKKNMIASIASIQKDIEKDKIVRDKNITDDITEEKALKSYFKDHENKDDIIKYGLELIETIRNENKI